MPVLAPEPSNIEWARFVLYWAEIIAVILILGLLVVITTPAYNTINQNIKTRNYQSKTRTIESETLSYVEKHLKDEVYDGDNHNHCFKVEYLIINFM